MSRKKHSEKGYTEKSVDEVSWYPRHPRVSLQLIQETGLGPEAAILDVGGGASVLVDCRDELHRTPQGTDQAFRYFYFRRESSPRKATQ